MKRESWTKINLPFKLRQPVLGLGADIKNSLCFAYRRCAFMSKAVNDLAMPENFQKFKRQAACINRHFGLSPRVIAYDSHPEYFSTKYILNFSRAKDVKPGNRTRLIPVQHHHAHIASCMLENKLKNQKVIGVAFDGTGFGGDSTLWGAEFLVADYQRFRRAAHLRYIPLVGGAKAVTQPWRVAAVWLCQVFGRRFLNLDLEFLKTIDKGNWAILERMRERNFNAPLASSIGRLFDAVAALILGIHQVRFEAEAAIRLEMLASEYKSRPRAYRFALKKREGVFIIDPSGVFRGIIADLKNKRNPAEIAAGFHLTVAQMISRTCLKINQDTRIKTVILSGGVFQNKLLLKLSQDLLEKEGFRIFTHSVLPCSDLSISLGQAVVAAFSGKFLCA
ncbi:hypothetical protein ACFL1D_05250 [Candidatus Omnitrophota bacterium]